jgi:hypothetical protein
MARALILGPKEMNDIRAAFDRARAKPIPWEILQRNIAPRQGGDILTLDNRKPGQIDRPASEQILIPVGYRMAISFEYQPAGLLAHFSFSVEGGKPGAMPTPISVEMLLDVLGFNISSADAGWTEEFLVDGKPGGLALNLVFMVEPNEAVAGHA